MTIFRTDSDVIRGFRCSGHAGFAEYGQDIVCAAISILVINTLNSIQRFLPEDRMTITSDEEEGLIECHFSQEPSEKCRLLLDTVIFGIEEVEKGHKGFVKLQEKRI